MLSASHNMKELTSNYCGKPFLNLVQLFMTQPVLLLCQPSVFNVSGLAHDLIVSWIVFLVCTFVQLSPKCGFINVWYVKDLHRDV